MIVSTILNTTSNYCLLTAEQRKQYTNDDMYNATIIMMDVLTNKMFDLMQNENIDLITCNAMAEQCGKELRQFIKTYTNIDMQDICKTP